MPDSAHRSTGKRSRQASVNESYETSPASEYLDVRSVKRPRSLPDTGTAPFQDTFISDPIRRSVSAAPGPHQGPHNSLSNLANADPKSWAFESAQDGSGDTFTSVGSPISPFCRHGATP